MGVLYFLEKCRMPVLNEAMLGITRLGEETAFLAAALILFWCVDKRRGYYLLTVGFFGTIASQFLKLTCRVPRPWARDENFTILEAARASAKGYSFPSGHSQTAVGTFGAIAVSSRRKWVRWICGAVCVLVPFSRMYVGVHTPADVLVGSAISLALIFLLRPVSRGEGSMKGILAALVAASLGLLAFVRCWPMPLDENLTSGVKNAHTMLGCVAGLAVVYPLEKKFVNFDPKARWWVQILKAVLGFLVVLAVKEGIRAPLELWMPQYPARAVRYFLVVVTAGLLWPMTFRYFAELGERKHELR